MDRTSELSNGAFVTRAGSVLSQKVTQVAVRSEFHDDVQRAVLSAAAEQIENVGVLADHFHHLHFRDEIHQLSVSVALYSNNDRAGQKEI